MGVLSHTQKLIFCETIKRFVRVLNFCLKIYTKQTLAVVLHETTRDQHYNFLLIGSYSNV